MPEAISEAVHAAPGGPLSGLVTRYDAFRQRHVPPARHLGLPAPSLTFIVTLDEPMQLDRAVDRTLPPASFRTLIGGLHASPVEIVHDGAWSGIQLAINPLASRALFGVPAGELANLDLDGEAVIGAAAPQLWERLGALPGWAERFVALDGVLKDRLLAAGPVSPKPPAPVSAAWTLLNASAGQISVARLAWEVGWSERQLEKAFAREIGMAPKQAARVIRFDRARRALQARARDGAPLDLARLAADGGYHDQPHLIRDFRSFTGLSPTGWLAYEFGNVQAAQAPAP
jgi:AraC-like DNA-binding protein